MAKIPFDISKRPQIESGEYKVETRDGKKVRVLCYDVNSNMPVIALVTFNNGSEAPVCYYSNGTMIPDRESPLDLFIITPKEELTEFEKEVSHIVDYCKERGIYVLSDYAKRHAESLLSLAKQQLLQSGELLTQEHHEKLMDALREECKKDLPRWKKVGVDTGQTNLIKGYTREEDELYRNGKYISLISLEKLPGFKEDESHE